MIIRILLMLGITSLCASAASESEHRLKEEWWAKRLSTHLKHAALGGHDLVFFGDSITQGFEKEGKEVWKKYYIPRNPINFGMSGDRTEHLIWILQHTDFSTIQPKVAVVHIGTNNTGHKLQAPAEIAADIKECVQLLRAKCPNTKILLLGVFPRGEKADDSKRKNNAAVNTLIAPLDDGKMVHYLDISKAFLDSNGVLSKDIVPDSLHPNKKGYRIWATAMDAKLTELGLPLKK